MQQFRQHGTQELEVRWHAEEIGEIEVKVGDEWHTIQSVLPEFFNRPARDWIAARQQIRRGDPQVRQASNIVIAKALKEIDRLNTAAGERAGILSERWDEAMLERFEANMLIGFKAGHEPDSAPSKTGHGYVINSQEQPQKARQAAPKASADTARKSSKNNTWKF